MLLFFFIFILSKFNVKAIHIEVKLEFRKILYFSKLKKLNQYNILYTVIHFSTHHTKSLGNEWYRLLTLLIHFSHYN